MRKKLILLIAAVFLIMPSVSFAKEAMTDNELSAISGEAGVTITFENLFLGSTIINSTSGDTYQQATPFIQKFLNFVKTMHHRDTGSQSSNTGSGSNTSNGNSINGVSNIIGLFATISGGLVIHAHGAPQ